MSPATDSAALADNLRSTSIVYTATMVYDAAGQLILARDEGQSSWAISSYNRAHDRLDRLASVDNLGLDKTRSRDSRPLKFTPKK